MIWIDDTRYWYRCRSAYEIDCKFKVRQLSCTFCSRFRSSIFSFDVMSWMWVSVWVMARFGCECLRSGSSLLSRGTDSRNAPHSLAMHACRNLLRPWSIVTISISMCAYVSSNHRFNNWMPDWTQWSSFAQQSQSTLLLLYMPFTWRSPMALTKLNLTIWYGRCSRWPAN